MKELGLLLFISFWIVSCGKKDGDHVLPSDDKQHSTLSIGTTTVSSDGDGKVEIPLAFDGLEDVQYLLIRKSGAGFFEDQVPVKDLTSSYNYIYQIQDEDPKIFDLVLNLHYTDGSDSRSQSVSVRNRKGEVVSPPDGSGDEVRNKLLVKGVTRIARVTGKTPFGENLPNPNNTDINWGVGGTDLGIIWEKSKGNYGIFFGDTFDNPTPGGSGWRSNVLAFSSNQDLDEGLVFDDMVKGSGNKAKEVIPGSTVDGASSIPTAAVRVKDADYVHVFKVNSWDPTLTTRYSTVYKSTDDGFTWNRVQNITFSADSKFALVGYFKKDGYVYMVGTPTYRSKPAYLARFKEADMELLGSYEYWNGNTRQWITGDESEATPIIEGTVGELSVIYNETYKKWIIAYFNAADYNITMKVADDITGPWDQTFVLATGQQYPQLYGSFFHPLSAKGDNLYFTMSMWGPYDVFWMKVELSDK